MGCGVQEGRAMCLVSQLKEGDFVQVPGAYFRPQRHGTFSSTIKEIQEESTGWRRLVLMGDLGTKLLHPDTELQAATTHLDYRNAPASRPKAKSIGGVTIE